MEEIINNKLSKENWYALIHYKNQFVGKLNNETKETIFEKDWAVNK